MTGRSIVTEFIYVCLIWSSITNPLLFCDRPKASSRLNNKSIHVEFCGMGDAVFLGVVLARALVSENVLKLVEKETMDVVDKI